MKNKQLTTNITNTIKDLLVVARTRVVQHVNTTMVNTYFEIGKVIVEHEQQGQQRAKYNAQTLKVVSQELTSGFGKGFSVTNLERMRLFYLQYSKSATVLPISDNAAKNVLLNQKAKTDENGFTLSWSHYVFLMRLDKPERDFYQKEAQINNWSLRELRRQFDSALFERVVLSRDKQGTLTDNLKKYHSPENSKDTVKDPYILEFLGLNEASKYTESELEQKIIDHLEHFLLELGKGFTFVGRQKRFTFDDQHFFIDLVFYHRLLRCFVVIDLKLGRIKHQDIGQMQMYVNYYDRFVKTEDENPTIGILLAKDKNETLVEITLPKQSNIFASEYKTYLPTKEQLQKQIEDV